MTTQKQQAQAFHLTNYQISALAKSRNLSPEVVEGLLTDFLRTLNEGIFKGNYTATL